MTGTVVVSGCSSGIGLALAKDLAANGYTVLAGVRTDADADRLARLSPRIRPVILDVTEPQHLEHLCDAAAGAPLLGLVNNAGVTAGGPLERMPVEEFDRVLQVNVLGAVRLTQALLPALRGNGGRVIFIGSLSARMPIPYLAPYAASKAALAAVSDCLRMELRAEGMHASLIEPASVPSAIWNKGRDQIDNWSAVGNEEAHVRAASQLRALVQREAGAARSFAPIAKAVRHALTARRPRPRYLVGAEARAVGLFSSLPRAMQEMVTEAFMRTTERRSLRTRVGTVEAMPLGQYGCETLRSGRRSAVSQPAPSARWTARSTRPSATP